MISHGNGPQVGLLALQASAYTEVEAYPLDVLGAETEGMIGYMIEQELGQPAPRRHPAGDAPHDDRGGAGRPSVRGPDQVRGTGLRRRPRRPRWRLRRAGSSSGTAIACGASSRSPVPRRIFELRPIKWLLEQGTVVICAGGGGIPTTWAEGQDRFLTGIEAVIDKDLASELPRPRAGRRPVRHGHRRRRRVRRLGHAGQRKLTEVTPEELRRGDLRGRVDGTEGGGGGPVRGADGRRAAIGSLADIERIVAGTAGTNVVATATADR